MSAPHREAFAARHRRAAEIRAAGIVQYGKQLIDLGRPEPIVAHLGAHPDPAAAWELSRRYLPNGGAAAVRDEVATYLGSELGLSLGREHVAVVAGGNAALTAALATLAGPGEEVVLPVPHYPPSPSQIELSGATPVLVECDLARPRLDPESLARVITKRTRAVLLTNPSNPTGVVYSQEELATLNHVLPPEVGWVIDEAYADIVYEGEKRPGAAVTLWGSDRPWLVVRTASKTVGRPGLRVAVLLGPAGIISRAEAMLACATGAAGSFAQVALAPALRAAGRGDVGPYAERLELALTVLAASELHPLLPQGSYYLWVRGSRRGDPIGTLDSVAELCRSCGVFVSPGELYGDPGGVRVSLSCSPQQIEDGIKHLAAHAGKPVGVS